MVSRVYTPLVTPYSRPQMRNVGSPPLGEAEQARQEPVASEDNNPGRQSSGLKAVQAEPFKKIPLDAVLHDFQSTLDALAADEKTRSEVVAYLQVVSLQGSKDTPEVPFMKQTLRTAAGTLDQFITRALGQPSQVVKEWVDALLLQDIDFHIQETPAWLAANPAIPSTTLENVSPIPTFNESDKAQVKALINTARRDFKTDGLKKAEAGLQRALDILEPHEQPLWKGKVWQVRARLQDKGSQSEQAVSSYEQAAQYFELGKRPDLQAEALHQAASILDEQGQYDRAAVHYQTVVTLDGQQNNPNLLLNSLNDLGSLYLRKGDTVNAVATLEEAAQKATAASAEAPLQSDVLNNLGMAYRARQNYPSAIQAFQKSLRLAQNIRDKSRYASTLQHLAAAYVENSQPELAMKALQRLSKLQSS